MPQRDNRGIGGFAPFPTFAPGGEGGLIPTVNMPQSRMSFPTPRGGGGGGGKSNAFAGIAPYAIDMLFNKVGSKTVQKPKAPPPPELSGTEITRDQIVDELGGTIEEANYLADQIYGPETITQPTRAGKFKPLVDLLGAAAFREPSEQAAYLRSYGAIQTGKGTTKVDKRSEFKNDYIKQQRGKSLQISPAYLIGDESKARNAIKSPRGSFFIHSKGEDEDRDGEGNQIEKGFYYTSPDWIVGEPPSADLSKFTSSNNEAKKRWKDARDEAEQTTTMLNNALPAINEVIGLIQQNPEITTWIAPFTRLKGELKAVSKNLFNVNKEQYKLAEKDGLLTWYDPREGIDTKSKISDTSVDEFTYLDEVWDPDTGQMKIVEKTFSFSSVFGDAAQDAAYRSAVLNLAYVAAASTGNTGKALSDRDLAIHLIQLGATFEPGGLKTPEAAIRSITGWYGMQLRKNGKYIKELETGSIASDYRRIFNEPTTWAEKFYEGEPNDKKVRRMLPLSAIWLNAKDQDFMKYMSLLKEAQRRHGQTAIPDDPIPGVDWQDYLRRTEPVDIDVPSGVVVPPPKKPGFLFKKKNPNQST